ncbi:MAG TPA: competence/damage-inducible protein A, partial [Ktedonobacteraceae bacterium]|nr:competence/damage-inducible protein A [Ktedonobacteraceae bacterium]
MRAEILSCGTELLLGHITDTNATYLAQSLAALGIDLYFVSQVGDNQGRIVETLRRAWERSDLIIMTGGLGPTEDDLARESISALLGETMQVDPRLEAELRGMFATRRSIMPERNIKQATLIPSAQALPNPRGTAPGWWVEKDGHIIVAMPGVPREMYQMWEREVVPRLSKYTGGLIFTRILRVWGLGESTVEERLQALLHNTNPTIATYAKSDAVDVRITAKAETREQAEQLVTEMEAQARQALGYHVFGVDKQTLQSVIGTRLVERRQSLAVMESLTGGLLASTITDEADSSRYFVGGIVSYSAELKIQMGVPREVIDRYGVISEETARAMAHAVRERLGADYGLGITGVAGPEKQEDKPVGTVYIAVEGPEGVVTGMGPGWRASREDTKRLSVMAALNLLRLHLEG